MNVRRGLRVLTALWALGFSFTIAEAQSAPIERDATFRNGEIELQGTMMLPADAGSHPTVVFLHGSGPATRAGARPYALEFAKLGIASLFFDKRGSGKSGGSWTAASLDDLAADALAAVHYLKAQPGVDPTRIGFWGVSQAGWVATLAAATSPDVAFMVIVSGGGATPRESEMYSYEQAFTRAGLSDAEKAEAFSVIEEYFRFLETGQNREQLVARIESARSSKWYPHARLDQILPSGDNVANWKWVATWDPAPHVARIKIPILLLFGDQDTSHPTAVAVQKWREGFKSAGNSRATIVVFPGADHGIRVRAGFTGTGRPPLADGYAEVMIGWLWMHVVQPRP